MTHCKLQAGSRRQGSRRRTAKRPSSVAEKGCADTGLVTSGAPAGVSSCARCFSTLCAATQTEHGGKAHEVLAKCVVARTRCGMEAEGQVGRRLRLVQLRAGARVVVRILATPTARTAPSQKTVMPALSCICRSTKAWVDVHHT